MSQTAQSALTDLVVLVPDADLENTVLGLFNRPESLRIRPVKPLIRRHQGRDPGCRTTGVDLLRMYGDRFKHALLMFDREGSGRDAQMPDALEAELEEKLARNGWQDRAAAIVIDPELEVWVWGDSREVDQIIGWGGRIESLRDWLVAHKIISTPNEKPRRPKETLRKALRHAGKRPSPALFRQLAERVSFKGCTDRAFQKLITKLQMWFPQSQSK